MKGFKCYIVIIASLTFGPGNLFAQHILATKMTDVNVPLQHGYQTLLNALEVADLEDVLAKSGPFTVFAPSDAAFKQIDAADFAALLKPERQHELRSLLTYHIVAGKLTASGILRALSRGKGAARFTTVQGEELLATLEGSDIILTDCSGNQARIVDADMNRDNLVFHQIDKVILPSPL